MASDYLNVIYFASRISWIPHANFLPIVRLLLGFFSYQTIDQSGYELKISHFASIAGYVCEVKKGQERRDRKPKGHPFLQFPVSLPS